MMRLFWTLILIALFTPTYAALCDDDQEAARQALARGEILPLNSVLKLLEEKFPQSNVIKLEFTEDKQLFKYKLKIIDSSNVIREIEVDAKTGQILKIELDD